MQRATHVSHIAIVGAGAAGLASFAALRQHGLAPETIAVYGDSAHPLATLERYARAIGQQRMRSEGNGHLSPLDFPGLALLDVWRQRSIHPLLAALVDAYQPSLDHLLAHTGALARCVGLPERTIRRRVARIRRMNEAAHFTLYDQAGAIVGHARHIVLALGHAGLAWPAAVNAWRDHPAIAHAYQAQAFRRGERVAVIGGGMAAAHLWIAALEAGAEVIALHRRPLRRQPLNAPRCAFSTAGISAYQHLDPSQRRSFHRQRSSSFPRRWQWEWRLWHARRAARFTDHQSEVIAISAPAGATAMRLNVALSNDRVITVDRLVCATGFQDDADAYPLVRQLRADHDAPVVDGMLCVADDFTLPQLSRPGSTCAIVGALARWALPVADTFVGMKYAARRLAPELSRMADI